MGLHPDLILRYHSLGTMGCDALGLGARGGSLALVVGAERTATPTRIIRALDAK
jgi:hypothetical protein